MKSFLGRVELFKINKIFENTLSLRVAGNGTAHSSQYFANSFKICFADRNLLTLESLSHGLCSKCTDLIEKSRTCLLSTDRSPVSFMSFVNFSQFNLGFREFRNYLMCHIINLVAIFSFVFWLKPYEKSCKTQCEFYSFYINVC